MNTTFTRRQVLKAAGAVATLGALNQEIKASAKTSFEFGIDGLTERLNDKRIVIIGGGIAGLIAAYELDKTGVEYTLIEASETLGGRVETIRSGDDVVEFSGKQTCKFDVDPQLYFNSGPGRISQNHKGILSYCHELNIPLECITNENPGAYIRTSSAFGNDNHRIRNIKSSIRGGVSELLAKSILKGKYSDIISENEVPLYLAMLSQFGDLDKEFNFIGTSRGGREVNTGVINPEKTSAPVSVKQIINMDIFSQFKLHLGDYLDQQATMMQPIEGMDNIVKSISKRLTSNIKTNSEVTSIKRNGREALVEYTNNGRKHILLADKVIVAIPPKIAANIDNDFSDKCKESLDKYVMSNAAKVAFQAERFWEREDGIYGGISYSSDDITLLWYPSNGIGNHQGVMIGAYNLGVFPSETFGSLPFNERIKIAIEQGSKIHTGYEEKVSNGVSRSWLQTPFIQGGWSLTPPDSVLFDPDGPFVYAGDHVSYMPGWMEGAVGSAHNALRNISVS